MPPCRGRPVERAHRVDRRFGRRSPTRAAQMRRRSRPIVGAMDRRSAVGAHCRGCATVDFARVANSFPDRLLAVAPASRPAVLLPACALCRSTTGTTSPLGIDGPADLVREPMSSVGWSVASSAAGARGHCHRHPEESYVNSLSVPTPRRRSTKRRQPLQPSPMLAVFRLMCHQNRRTTPTFKVGPNMAKAGTAAINH
jgi:hypothetical protein